MDANGYDCPVGFSRKKLRNLSFKDEDRLRRLIDRFGEVKKNYVLKVRYVQIKMRYRRMKNLLFILKQNTRVYWPAIFHFIKENDYPSPAFDCIIYCTVTFLDVLLAVGCSDANSLEKILKLYGYYCALKNKYLVLPIWEEVTTSFSSFHCSIFHSSICNNGCNATYAVKHFDADLDFAMRANDLKFMTALLKYGINVPHSASCSEWVETIRELDDFWIRWLYPVGVTLSHFNEVWENFCNASAKRGNRRLGLIAKMLRILDIKWCRESNGGPDLATYPVYTDKQFYDCVQCMKLYFRATVEPLISKDDIVEFISTNPIWHGVPDYFLATIAQNYKDLFPEQSYAIYSPRTLKHLCRYSLRKSLTEKKIGVLPELVENLFIPKRLRSYLLCEY